MTSYIPFGYNCAPANILKQAGLRKQSLPFDWLFAYPYVIKDSLDTNFKEWFDKSNLTYLKSKDGRDVTICKPYHINLINTEEAGLFNHHDLRDIGVQKAFKRRIQRFKDIIASDENVVFLTTSSQEDMVQNGLLDYFNRTAKTDFVFLEHSYSAKNKVTSSIKGGYLTIKYMCEGNLSNPIISTHIANILKTIDIPS